MKLIALTLSGGNREKDAPDAWRSVADYVDHYLLVDTGESAQKAISIALQMPEVRDRCSVVTFPGEYGAESCADGRNFALLQAGAVADAFWPGQSCFAMMLDTDETIEIDPSLNLKETLAEVDSTVALTWMEGFAYPKERFFKLPTIGAYKGRVHEYYVDDNRNSWSILGGIVVHEKSKSKEETDAVMRRVRDVCLQEVVQDRNNQRAWMYLGNACAHFGEYPLAKHAFLESYRCSSNDDQRGWLAFKVAAVCHVLKDWDEAVRIASDGMRYAPYHPELPWACAFAEWSRGNVVRAAAWADQAIVLGAYSPLTRANPVRAYARFPSAAREGPWEIRCACFQSMTGNDMIGVEVQKAYDMIKKAMEEGGRIAT